MQTGSSWARIDRGVHSGVENGFGTDLWADACSWAEEHCVTQTHKMAIALTGSTENKGANSGTHSTGTTSGRWSRHADCTH